MRKIITTLGLLLGVLSYAQITPMITKWKTSSASDKQIAINTKGGGYYTYTKVDDPKITDKGVLKDGLKTTIYLPFAGEYIVKIKPPSDLAPSALWMGQTKFEESAELMEISQWGNFSKGPSCSMMLAHCKNVVITATDIPNFSQTTDMSNMFYNCKAIKSIPKINQWDVSKVTEMQNMFFGVYQFNDNISAWNTQNVTDMSRMFSQPNNIGMFNQNIGNWNTSKVTKLYEMFRGCKQFNQDLSNWKTENVVDFEEMFIGATSFNQDLKSFSLKSAKYLEGMFDYSGMSCNNYEKTLKSWSQNTNTPSKLTIGATNIKYGDKTYRNLLISEKNWAINGDIFDPSCSTLSINDNYTKTQDFKIINPVNNILKIKGIINITRIEIYSLNGQLIKTVNKQTKDISDLSEGVYILKIYKDNIVNNVKIIKK